MQRPRAIIIVSTMCCLVGGASAMAQSTDADVLEPKQERMPGVFYDLSAGVDHQFRTDIGGGGRFEATRAHFGLGMKTELTSEIDLSLRMSYNLDLYDFSGDSFGGGDPWDDIHTLNFVGIVSMAIDSDWTVFGGPALQFSRESGASWGDGFVGGGFLGVSYAASDTLTLGGGFGVVSQIEDSTRVFPVVNIHWQITDLLRLTSQTATSASGNTGVELVYDLGSGWEAGLGMAWRMRRFRLDDGGPAPDGVGEERSIPLWGRVSYHINPNTSVNLFVGAALEGELRLENESGRRIAEEDYDATPVIGLSGTLRF